MSKNVTQNVEGALGAPALVLAVAALVILVVFGGARRKQGFMGFRTGSNLTCATCAQMIVSDIWSKKL